MSLERNKDDSITNNNNFISIISRVVKISDDKWDKNSNRRCKNTLN